MKQVEIDYTTWNEIKDTLSLSICRGEEKTLTDEETRVINRCLADALKELRPAFDLLVASKKRFGHFTSELRKYDNLHG